MRNVFFVLMFFQYSVTLSQTVYVAFESNVPTASVLINDRNYGLADRKTFIPFRAGQYTVRLQPPDSLSWTLKPIQRTLRFNAMDGQDSIFVGINFPSVYYFTSKPFGMPVFSSGIMGIKKQIGTTPLHFSSFQSAEKFWIEQDGWISDTLFAQEVRFLHHEFVIPTALNRSMLVESAPQKSKISGFIFSGIAIGGGIYAAYHKLKADDLYYGEYAQTGNPALKEAINRQDRKAAIGLGVMQSGMIGLTIYLIRR